MYVSLTDLEAEPFKEGEEEDHPSSPEKGPHDALQKLYDALSEDEDDSMPTSSGMPGGNPTDDDGDESNHGDSEDNTAPKARGRRKGDSQARNPARKLKLHYTLVICYLSCFTMRIPILIKDILE